MYKILKVRNYKAGYQVREELIDGTTFGGKDFVMKSAYNLKGDYIGNPKDAYRLCKKRGIAPEKADAKDNVCSIGFCKKDGKWYGWSHRAIYGFKAGDVVKKGDCCTESGTIDPSPGIVYVGYPSGNKSLPVGFKAETLEDAKKMAIAFADSVS